MKTKYILITGLLVIAAGIGGYLIAGQTGSRQQSSEAAAPDVVKAFYDSWIGYEGNPLSEKYYQKTELLTPELKSRLDGIVSSMNGGGYDPVLCAQDKPASFQVRTINADPNAPRFAVDERFGNATTTVTVDVANVNNAWRLSAITCADGSTIGEQEKQTLVGDYIRQHISELSPQKEVLGGKFYITQIRFVDNSRAVVEYEDGHIALVGLATYAVSPARQVQVTSFKDFTGNLDEQGNLAINAPGLKKDTWYLLYEQPGKPGLSAELVFNQDSICFQGSNTSPCPPALSSATTRVRATGKLVGTKLTVYAMFSEAN